MSDKTCKHCNVTFSSKQAMKNHESKSVCMKRNMTQKQKEEKDETRNTKMSTDKAEKHDEKHEENDGIELNDFGFEEMSAVSLDDLTLWASDPHDGCISYLKAVHYNPNMPENHNIKNVSDTMVGVYINGKWETMPRTEFSKKVAVVVERLFHDVLMLRQRHAVTSVKAIFSEKIEFKSSKQEV